MALRSFENKVLTNKLNRASQVTVSNQKTTIISTTLRGRFKCSFLAWTCQPVPTIIENVYSRVRKGQNVFTSLIYTREKKRNNYTVKFKTGASLGYGQINLFFLHNMEIFAAVEKFQIDHTKIFIHDASEARVKHIVPIAQCVRRNMMVINVKDIVAKVIRVGNFLCNLWTFVLMPSWLLDWKLAVYAFVFLFDCMRESISLPSSM